MGFDILAIDVSGVGHQIWHTITPSTPALEMREFTGQFFRRVYQAILETSPQMTFFVMDAQKAEEDVGNYWRHAEYREWYTQRSSVAIDSEGTLWMRHDAAFYKIEQIGTGIFAKVEKKREEAEDFWAAEKLALDAKALEAGVTPEAIWKAPLEAATRPEFQPYLQQIRDNFPRYKGGRGKSKWANTTPKSEWLRHLDELVTSISEVLGAAKIRVHQCEADDVMFGIASTKKPELSLCIMARDRDMDQLQSFGNVVRYDPFTNEFLEVEDPMYGIRCKVLCGDSGDNVKSIRRPVPRNPTKKDPRTVIYKSTGVKGAQELLSAGNLPEVARSEGWLKELEFNTRMIHLGSAPEELRDAIKVALWEGVNNVVKKGRIDSFEVPMSDIQAMRATATVRKMQFSGSGTAEEE